MSTQPFAEDAEDLYQHAPFGYFTMQADGRIVNINKTLLQWLGYERGELVFQKSFQDFLGMGEKIYFETHLRPMLQIMGEISEINLTLYTKESAKLPALINGKLSAGATNTQPVYRLSVLKILQRKHYEVELMNARKNAEQMVQRLQQINQELEQFAYIASHDLQAPIRTISGMIDIMEKKGYFAEGSEMLKYFSLIKSNAKRMKLMISDLLEYAKIDGPEKEFKAVSLNEICAFAIEIIAAEVSESKAVFIIPELPVVPGNKMQLVRLFQNIFDNAIKYRSDANPVISLEFEEKEDEITVFIKDNGIGFEQKFAGQVFGFMKRLHSHDSIPGTGIGLSACKRIVELHGGTIGAESAPGKGTTFYFTLSKMNRNTITDL